MCNLLLFKPNCLISLIKNTVLWLNPLTLYHHCVRAGHVCQPTLLIFQISAVLLFISEHLSIPQILAFSLWFVSPGFSVSSAEALSRKLLSMFRGLVSGTLSALPPLPYVSQTLVQGGGSGHNDRFNHRGLWHSSKCACVVRSKQSMKVFPKL